MSCPRFFFFSFFKGRFFCWALFMTISFQLLDFENEEIRSAASFALGSIAVGNLSAFLPSILSDIESSKRQVCCYFVGPFAGWLIF